MNRALTIGRARPASPVRRIREAVIGDDRLVAGPYGPRRLTYADHTASGRALTFVEDEIRDEILPWYANTHSEASATGRRTTHRREEARRTIHAMLGGAEDTVVIFTGSGSTGAIDKFVRVIAPTAGTVVFVGPYEHHSNELLWRESGATVVRVDADARGHIDAAHLERELCRHAGAARRIGSFSAGSNVTGVRTDVPAIGALLRRHGALACFDYAAAGAHGPVVMFDAVFLSPHKFPGGPGTPGVLAVRRALLANPVPTVPGGGTISYVHPTGQQYLDEPAQREEGGTPAIVESIRAGLVFALHRSVAAAVPPLESRMVRRALDSWSANPAIDILGDTTGDRLPIVSFVIRPPGGRPLHHHFVVALLNDLFGIQARGGCSCAGPYGHRLLGIDETRARAFAASAATGWFGVKPGWTRVSFAFYMSDTVVDYIIEAVHLVATRGARLLPEYRFDPRSGMWSHRDFVEPAAAPRVHVPEVVLPGHLAAARTILAERPEPPDDGHAPIDPDFDRQRWFRLPDACLDHAPAVAARG
jgi:selenocysteine lyase/cysteine desulfurase